MNTGRKVCTLPYKHVHPFGQIPQPFLEKVQGNASGGKIHPNAFPAVFLGELLFAVFSRFSLLYASRLGNFGVQSLRIVSKSSVPSSKP